MLWVIERFITQLLAQSSMTTTKCLYRKRNGGWSFKSVWIYYTIGKDAVPGRRLGSVVLILSSNILPNNLDELKLAYMWKYEYIINLWNKKYSYTIPLQNWHMSERSKRFPFIWGQRKNVRLRVVMTLIATERLDWF